MAVPWNLPANAQSLGGSGGMINLHGGTLLLHNNGATNLGDSVGVVGTSAIDVNLLSGTTGGVTQSLGALTIGSATLTTTGSNSDSLSFGTVTLTGSDVFNTLTANATLGSVTGSYGITKSGSADSHSRREPIPIQGQQP